MTSSGQMMLHTASLIFKRNHTHIIGNKQGWYFGGNLIVFRIISEDNVLIFQPEI